MEILEMIEQSGIMALVGMGVVFSFLIILVFAITITGKIVGRFQDPEPEIVPVTAYANTGSADGAITAAITAAINMYNKNIK